MSICRACLCSINEETVAINIFEDLHRKTYNLSILLPVLFNIKIEINDEITKKICVTCANKIVQFHEFYLMYIESDRKLRSLIETDRKPNLDSYDFETGNVSFHEFEPGNVKKEVVYVESLKFEASDSDDDSRENCRNSQPPAVVTSEPVPLEWVKEKKPKRLVSIWQCFACHKTYKWRKSMRNHSKLCNGMESQIRRVRGSYKQKDTSNEFICDICGNCLSTRNNLSKHNKTVHLKEKNYQCTTCEKRYDSAYRLRIHQNSHNGIRQFSCTLCPQTFITTSAVSRHKKTVHKQGELYECPVCLRKFNIAYNLRAHMVTHTGIRPHNCQHCKAGFQRKHKLVSHLKEVHGLEYT